MPLPGYLFVLPAISISPTEAVPLPAHSLHAGSQTLRGYEDGNTGNSVIHPTMMPFATFPDRQVRACQILLLHQSQSLKSRC